MMRAIIITSVIVCFVSAVAGLAIMYKGHLDFADRERIVGRLSQLRENVIAQPSDTSSLQSLIKSLDSSDPFEQQAAATQLGLLRQLGAPAADRLAKAAKSPDPYLQREAVLALGRIGKPARIAIPSLLDVMETHKKSDSGWFAAEALGEIANSKDVDVISALSIASQDRDTRLRQNAKAALEKLSR
jgi:HEAT repeat protein